MDWSGMDYLLIIVMFLSAVWTLILTAPIHCKASIGNAKFHQICSDKETNSCTYVAKVSNMTSTNCLICILGLPR